MTKLTWLGPDDYEAGETPPSSCTWNGITFPVGVAVEVDNPWMIAKARGNKFFRVEENAASVGPAKPEMWTNDPLPEVNFFDDPPGVDEGAPPDYPPEDDPERGQPKRKRGRPPKVREYTDDNGE